MTTTSYKSLFSVDFWPRKCYYSVKEDAIMPAINVHFLLQGLDLRRKKLGMSHAVLAKRAGLSMRTVVRVLSGSDPHAGFANVVAIAEVLGMEVKFKSKANVEELRERQARQKAQRLVGMVQGTMGLEGQAVDRGALAEMVEQTIHELLAGSKRRLWSD